MIRVELPVAPPGTMSTEPLPYWPRYDRLLPAQRAVYLDWMASGRMRMPPQIGYAFIFLYGLERRALVDGQDQKRIFDEVYRLRRLNARDADAFNRSFETYSLSLLWFLAVTRPDLIALKRVRPLVESVASWNEESLAAMLCWFATVRLNLPGWAAFVVAGQMPQAQQSVVVSRLPQHFRDLFLKRFAQQYPEGFALQSAKRPRRYSHCPASEALTTATWVGPNPLGLASQFKPLVTIWNECIQELRKLSSVAAREGTPTRESLSVAAWEAMPDEIRANIDHPLTEPLCAMVARYGDDEGHSLVPVSELAQVILPQLPAGSGALTLTQSRRLAEVAGDVGYCVEPDARMTRRSYRMGQHVGLFLRSAEFPSEHSRYAAAAAVLEFGLMLANADGHIDEDEVRTVMQHIEETFDLNAEESRRLCVLHSLLQMENRSGIAARSLKTIPEAHRHAVARMALVMAAVDGVVTDEELRLVRRACGDLGLPDDAVEEMIRTVIPPADSTEDSDEPVVMVKPQAADPGEAIPPPRPLGRLSRSAIDQILKQSEEVARLLHDAMTEHEEESEPDAPSPRPVQPVAAAAPMPMQPTPPPAEMPAPAAAQATAPSPKSSAGNQDVIETDDPTLPQRYARLMQALLVREQWTLKEADALARAHGHMLNGAIEVLNDWAFETKGSQLFIEEGDRLVIEREILQ